MPVLVSLHPFKGNPGSGIREIIACGTRKLGNFSLWNPESWAAWNPQYHSRNLESQKRLPSGIQFPLTKTGIQFLESGIYGVESRIQDCLGFPYIGRKSLSRVKKKPQPLPGWSLIQVPLKKTGIQFLESRIQDCLEFPYIGRKSLSRVK